MFFFCCQQKKKKDRKREAKIELSFKKKVRAFINRLENVVFPKCKKKKKIKNFSSLGRLKPSMWVVQFIKAF